MKSLIILSCLAMAYAAPQFFGQPAAAPAVAAPAAAGIPGIPTYTYVPSAQFHSQNEFGGYNYGYVSADGQGKNELRGADGSVIGTYSYLDALGKPIQVQYSAGPGGFMASGPHLPQPVPLPAANILATQEHMQAKAVAAAKAAAAAAAAQAAAPAAQPTAAFFLG